MLIIIQIMKRMYSKCDLIHADLSEFNLLWYLNRIWVIDVSQSVMIVHPHALQFLLRDCYNITNVKINQLTLIMPMALKLL